MHHRWLGLPVRDHDVELSDIARVDIEVSGRVEGNTARNRTFYRVVATTREGTRFGIAWNLDGESAARAAAERFERVRIGASGDDRRLALASAA